MTHPEHGFFLCFVGPAGAGKSSLTRFLLSKFPQDLTLAISATSRAPRPGELEGEHYYFLSRSEFEREAQAGRFFEWEETHGNYYGTPQRWVDDVVERGKRVLLDVDVRGAIRFQRSFPEHFVGVLILPPSLEELIARVRARGGLTDEDLRVRLATAARELGDFETALRAGTFDHLILNDQRESAEREAEDIFQGRAASLSSDEVSEKIAWMKGLAADIQRYALLQKEER